MTEADKLHVESLTTFVNQNYEQALSSVYKILKIDERRKNDPRVQHNVAVMEFFKGGCVETEKLQQDLRGLGKLERKPDQKAPENKKESKFLCLEFHGHEIAVFNEAVLLYHSRQHSEAINLLLSMFDNREVIPETLAVRAALLLLAAILASYKKSAHLHSKIPELTTYLDSMKSHMEAHDEEVASSGGAAISRNGTTLCGSPLMQQYWLLQAELQMLTQDVRGALATLHEVYQKGNESQTPSASFLPTLYFNNLGVVHMMMNKPHTASMYLAKAVESFEKYKSQYGGAAAELTSPSGTGLGNSRVGSAICHVLYNNAMCLLMREKYDLAFRSLTVATPLLHTLPSLWLRLAQCCVKLHELNIRKEREEKTQDGQPNLVQVRTTPTGTIYRLPIRGSTTATTFHTSATFADANTNTMSLTFADKCLRNAHYLLLRQGKLLLANSPRAPRAKAEGPEGATPEGTPSYDEANSGSHTPTTEEVLEALAQDPHYSPMLQAVYVNMSYVALAMNNPSIALHEAKQLLNMSNCSKENKIVTLSYIAEALCWLNKPSQALQILHGVNLQELLADKMSELNRRNAEALFVNLSIVHIMQSKYQRAQECVKQFISRSSSNHSILLQIYLDLVQGAQGNRERVIELLRKHAHNVTLPL